MTLDFTNGRTMMTLLLGAATALAACSAGSTPPATAALAVPAAPPGPQPDPSPYQPDMTTGRIAPLTTSFGGRPNVTPATYYFDGQDELASMSMGA